MVVRWKIAIYFEVIWSSQNKCCCIVMCSNKIPNWLNKNTSTYFWSFFFKETFGQNHPPLKLLLELIYQKRIIHIHPPQCLPQYCIHWIFTYRHSESHFVVVVFYIFFCYLLRKLQQLQQHKNYMQSLCTYDRNIEKEKCWVRTWSTHPLHTHFAFTLKTEHRNSMSFVASLCECKSWTYENSQTNRKKKNNINLKCCVLWHRAFFFSYKMISFVRVKTECVYSSYSIHADAFVILTNLFLFNKNEFNFLWN